VPQRQQKMVLLTVAADKKESEGIEAVAAELLGRLSLQLQYRRVERIDLDEIAIPRSSSRGYLACAYIDLRMLGTATLYLVDPAHDRVLIRRVERMEDGEEVAREQLGHILESSAEGLLAGMQFGMPREAIASTLVSVSKAPSRAGPTAPVASSPPRLSSWQLDALYEGQVTSAGTPITHGPALGVIGRRAVGRMAIGLWLIAQHRFRYELESRPVGVKIGADALRMLATLDVNDGALLSWRFALGGGVDVVNMQPTSTDSAGVVLASSRSLAFALARAEIGARLRLGDIGHVLAAGFADIDPSDTSYVFSTRTGQQMVMRPWIVRPGFSLGVELP
jgi:hypothetical protein